MKRKTGLLCLLVLLFLIGVAGKPAAIYAEGTPDLSDIDAEDRLFITASATEMDAGETVILNAFVPGHDEYWILQEKDGLTVPRDEKGACMPEILTLELQLDEPGVYRFRAAYYDEVTGDFVPTDASVQVTVRATVQPITVTGAMRAGTDISVSLVRQADWTNLHMEIDYLPEEGDRERVLRIERVSDTMPLIGIHFARAGRYQVCLYSVNEADGGGLDSDDPRLLASADFSMTDQYLPPFVGTLSSTVIAVGEELTYTVTGAEALAYQVRMTDPETGMEILGSNPPLRPSAEGGTVSILYEGQAGLLEGYVWARFSGVWYRPEEIRARILADYNWGTPEYVWADDFSQVTARRVSQAEPSIAQTETVNTTGEVTREATCVEKGETTYTSAAFANEAFETQAKTVEDIPARGHTLKVRARVDAGCTEPGAEACWECEACGELFSDEEGENRIEAPMAISPRGHAWNSAEYRWTEDHAAVTAVRTCGNDAAHMETETAAVTVMITSPTETAEGSVTYTSAAFANDGFSVQIRNEMIPALSSMSVMHLPGTLKAIEDEAFAHLACEAVIVPEGCASIGNYAFRDCGNLRYIRVPAGAEIASDAFEGCENVVIDRVAE